MDLSLSDERFNSVRNYLSPILWTGIGETDPFSTDFLNFTSSAYIFSIF